MKLYFAHPVTMYDTPVERALQERMQRQLPGVEVENPNQPQHTVGYQAGGMDYFVKVCDQQDGVFFAPFANGGIGAGVAKEVQSFARRGAPMFQYEPATQSFAPVSAADVAGLPVMDVPATRAQLQLERQQKPYGSLDAYTKGLDVTA